MKRLLFAGLLCAVLGAASVLTLGAYAATLTVTNSNNSGPGSLRESIALAAPGDTITFDPSLAGQPIILTSGELFIDKSLTIQGLGAEYTVIDANGLSRVLKIAETADVTVTGVTVQHGFEVRGGGIYNEGSLALTECTVTSNVTGFCIDGSCYRGFAQGCGIQNLGTLVLSRTLVSNNRTLVEESISPGGGLNNSGRAIILHSSFTGNSGSSSRRQGLYGAGIYNDLTGDLQFIGSTLTGNIGVTGGIWNSGNMLLDSGIVEGNFSSGTACFYNEGTVVIQDSAIQDNQSAVLAMAGGIENYGAMRILRSTVANHRVRGPFSIGGILNCGNLSILNSTIANNDNAAPLGVGGIANTGTIYIVASTISGNRSNDVGGFKSTGTASVKSSVIAGNFCPLAGDGYPCEGTNRDCAGSGTSLGNNLVGDNTSCSWLGIGGSNDIVGVDWSAILEQIESSNGFVPLLADNGGPSPTVALIPNSSALDAVALQSCTDVDGNALLVDQRGTPRPQGAACDIGAFEFSLPRGAGFWGHQCSDKGFHQVSDEELQALLTEIAETSSVFPECAPCSCEFLQPQAPQNDLRARAQQHLLDVWLNLSSGRLTRGRPVDLAGLTTATTVGEALSELEMTVCDPESTHGDLANAKEIAEALNSSAEDLELAAEESAISLLTGATRTITLGLINMSTSSRNYSLTVSGPWPVQLSTSRVNALGSGQVAQITATITAPLKAPAPSAPIRITATDLLTQGTLKRDVSITVSLASNPKLQPVQKPMQVN